MGFFLNCLLLSFLYLLIVKTNQASACTERLANASPMASCKSQCRSGGVNVSGGIHEVSSLIPLLCQGLTILRPDPNQQSLLVGGTYVKRL